MRASANRRSLTSKDAGEKVKEGGEKLKEAGEKVKDVFHKK